MSIDHAGIASLAEKLARSEAASLTAEECRLLAGALRELALAQALIARQSLLLQSFEQDTSRIERGLRASVAAARDHLSAPPASDAYDFAGAARARADLADRLRDSESLREVIEWALRFAAAMTALA